MKTLTREQSIKILQDNLDKPIMQAFNSKASVHCRYTTEFADGSKCYCAVGLLFKELELEIIMNGSRAVLSEGVIVEGLSSNLPESFPGAPARLKQLTGLKFSELRELQTLHDNVLHRRYFNEGAQANAIREFKNYVKELK